MTSDDGPAPPPHRRASSVFDARMRRWEVLKRHIVEISPGADMASLRSHYAILCRTDPRGRYLRLTLWSRMALFLVVIPLLLAVPAFRYSLQFAVSVSPRTNPQVTFWLTACLTVLAAAASRQVGMRTTVSL